MKASEAAQRFDVVSWGARGTLPATGEDFNLHGGATCCVELRLDDRIVVLDAGSGIVDLGQNLVRRDPCSVDLLISHAHLDHVIGLPFFEPLFRPDWQVTLWFAGVEGAPDSQALLDTFIRPPTLPFTSAEFTCQLALRQIPRNGQVEIDAPFQISTAPLNHPGGNTGLRIDHGGRSFAYCSDYEPDDGPSDATLRTFIAGADLAFLDSTYTPDERPAYRGFGHADWLTSCNIARSAGVGSLGLFHHAPQRQDAELLAIAKAAGATMPSHAVRQGDCVDLLTGGWPSGRERLRKAQDG